MFGLSVGNSIKMWRDMPGTGFPKFRSYKIKEFFPLEYEDPFTGYSIKNNKLNISCGTYLDINNKKQRIKLSIPFKNNFKIDKKSIKNLKIIKSYGIYYACFILKVSDIATKSIIKTVALDPNHKNFAVSFDNNQKSIEFSNLKNIKITSKRIGKLQQKQSKLVKNSKKYNHIQNIINDLRRVVRDQKKVYLRTLSNYLCKNYDLIGVGNYTPFDSGIKKINNITINQSMIGEFRVILEQICKRSGKKFYKYDEVNTTKTCSKCGFSGDKIPLNIREWDCVSCKFHHKRDENAAQNGLKIVLKQHNLPCLGYLDVKSRYTYDYDCRNVVVKIRN